MAKTSTFVDVTLMVGVAPKDYIEAMLRLLAEVIYWTDCKTFAKYESFTHPNLQIWGPGLHFKYILLSYYLLLLSLITNNLYRYLYQPWKKPQHTCQSLILVCFF